jgi:hypothetical protein
MRNPSTRSKSTSTNQHTMTPSLLLVICTALALMLPSASGFPSRFGKNVQKQTTLESTKGDNSNDRKPWEIFRFLQQSSKFVTLPFLAGKTQLKVIQPGAVLWSASERKHAFTMAPLDDVVMGGASSSTFDGNTGIWTGTVTDANNGGFIGIRSTPSFLWNMNSCKGLEYKLKTSSSTTKSFKFAVRDSTEFNGIVWATSVDVKPGLSTVKVPFDKQVPTLFAKIVPDQTFRKDNVVGIQLTFSKFAYDGGLNPKFSLGGVNLQIIEIRAY